MVRKFNLLSDWGFPHANSFLQHIERSRTCGSALHPELDSRKIRVNRAYYGFMSRGISAYVPIGGLLETECASTNEFPIIFQPRDYTLWQYLLHHNIHDTKISLVPFFAFRESVCLFQVNFCKILSLSTSNMRQLYWPHSWIIRNIFWNCAMKYLCVLELCVIILGEIVYICCRRAWLLTIVQRRIFRFSYD